MTEISSPRYATTLPVAFANGQSASEQVNLRGLTIKAILRPAGFTGTHVAVLRVNGASQYLCQDEDGAPITIAITEGRSTELNSALFLGLRNIALRACSAEDGTPVNQGGGGSQLVLELI